MSLDIFIPSLSPTQHIVIENINHTTSITWKLILNTKLPKLLITENAENIYVCRERRELILKTRKRGEQENAEN